MTRWSVALALVLAALPVLPTRAAPPAAVAAGTPPLAVAAADDVYGAETPAALQAAMARARAAAPGGALVHELEAWLAVLEGRDAGVFEHLAAALADPADDAALLHLAMLDEALWTVDETGRAKSLLRRLSRSHPDPEVRSMAALVLAQTLDHQGDDDAAASLIAARGTPLRFKVIGSWDNDQGKGFDTRLPPEDRVDLTARYPGSVLEIGWRDPAVEAIGTLDLASVMTPWSWSVAFGVATVKVAREGDYEVRIGTTDPVKVWVNGVEVLSLRRLDPEEPEVELPVPVRLRTGVNRILVKSANEQGTWRLWGLVTAPGGAPAAGVVAADPGAVPADGPPPGGATTMARLLDRRSATLRAGAIRQAVQRIRWARMIGARELAVEASEALVQSQPKSLSARLLLATQLWDKGERDRAADLLADVDREAGDALPWLRLQHARFLGQQGLKQDARKLIVGVRHSRPELPLAAWRLADHFGDEGWTEDRCRSLQEVEHLRPGLLPVRIAWADCLDALGFRDRAAALYQDVVEAMPHSVTALKRLFDQAVAAGDNPAAERWARRRIDASPAESDPHIALADVLHRLGDDRESVAELRRAMAIDPDRAEPWRRLGTLRWQASDRAGTIEAWEAALERDPKDGALAQRVEFLAPPSAGPWMTDVPDDQAIEAAVAQRTRIKPQQGADVLYLMADYVDELRPDGSRRQFVTDVLMAVNDEGRDVLTKYEMHGSRTRLLRAYAVAPNGRRSEASSIRGREVRFRGLVAGSVVVLQYRWDNPPLGYLARHMAQNWLLQSSGWQLVQSRWVLWMPAGTTLHESVPDGVVRDERPVGDRVRVSWTARDLPPPVAEAGMPPARDVLKELVVSTVPDWDTFVRWQASLLEEAFRENSDLVALADRIGAASTDPWQRALAIQQYLVEEVRYQQDYESDIAGVKPHAAPTVLERRYGDCKDKTVLFLALARHLGIEAHFALVRTRDAGHVVDAVPMQQFNHVIVYLPAQPGIPEGRFLDPTADGMDLDVLRPDDPGTRSLVYDPWARVHVWRDIPFQAPDVNRLSAHVRLTLAADGTAEGDLQLSGRGSFGQWMRRGARNLEKLTQGLRQLASKVLDGGMTTAVEPGEVKDLRVPATIRVGLRSASAGRPDGDTLRLKLPTGWDPAEGFPHAERHFPLVLAVPHVREWQVDLTLPAGASVRQKPRSGKVETDCLRMERDVEVHGTHVTAHQRFTLRCERIPVDQFERTRAAVDDMVRWSTEDLVVTTGSRKAAR